MLPATLTTIARLVLRLVDFERSAIHILTIQILNRPCCIGARHFHEAEATRTSGLPVGYQRNRINDPVLREERSHCIVGGGEGQIAYIDLAHVISHLSGANRTG